MKTIKNQEIKDQEMSNFLNGFLRDDQLIKFVSSLKVDYFDDDTAEITFQLDLEKEVKPLFPTKEQGAKYAVSANGNVFNINDSHDSELVELLVKQGRTFYTLEDAEAFVRREQSKVYCLEAINSVNEGDNGFRLYGHNFYIRCNLENKELDIVFSKSHQQSEPNEYIRTREAAQELINDPEFVEGWKIFKGVEGAKNEA